MHIVNNYYTIAKPDGRIETKTVPSLVTSTREVKVTQTATVTAPPLTVTMSLGGALKTFTLTSHAPDATGGIWKNGKHRGGSHKDSPSDDADLLASADPEALKDLDKSARESAGRIIQSAASSAGWGNAPTPTATPTPTSIPTSLSDILKVAGVDGGDDDAKKDKDRSGSSSSSSSSSSTSTASCSDTDLDCLLKELTATSTSGSKPTSTTKPKHDSASKLLAATHNSSGSHLSVGAIIAIVAAAIAALLVLLGLIMMFRRRTSSRKQRRNDAEWRRPPPQMTQQSVAASSVPYAYGSSAAGPGQAYVPPANYRTLSNAGNAGDRLPGISINGAAAADPFNDRNAAPAGGHSRSSSSASRQTVPPIDENAYYRGPFATGAGPSAGNDGRAGAPRW